ncbi:MAG: hypothetical protein ACOX21_01075 [Bacillota bacterium]|nr:hypothetical protein [Bacillota bacterium]HPZ21823.1 hypothetical protein [Bacillota bacterium]HQD19417.1 hypothetical protein [Bacillota bacterium]
MQAEKLSHGQIRELIQHFSAEPLENYELMWVLESCLETPSSSVYGLGAFPWAGGLVAIHRQCIWLRLDNEMHLETLLAPLPDLDLCRFYTAGLHTLDMLQRWFPGGVVTQSSLCVRNLTSTWKKRFEVTVSSNPDPHTLGGWDYEVYDADGVLAATCSSQQVVSPWQEIIEWVGYRLENYWVEQAYGAVTAELLGRGSPVVIRADTEELSALLAPLGYREFGKLYYYVAPREL